MYIRKNETPDENQHVRMQREIEASRRSRKMKVRNGCRKKQTL
jgi:hypothetical protein